jgi:hypothetical protein
MRSTTTLLPGSLPEESALTSMRVDHVFLLIEKKTLPLLGGRHCSPPTCPLRVSTASSPGQTKNRPVPWSAEEDARGGALGQLLFISTEPHSLDRGSGQHRAKRTGTCCRASSLQNLPLESRAIPATEMRKAEAGEGDRRQKAGWSVC